MRYSRNMATRSLLLFLTLVFTLWSDTAAGFGRGKGSADHLENGNDQEKASKGGSTRWKLVSAGRPVSVDPPMATCGASPEAGRNLLNLSHPDLAYLRKLLTIPKHLLKDPSEATHQTADTPFQCTTHPGCTENQAEKIQVLGGATLRLPDQCGGGSGGSDPCSVNLTMLGARCPNYTVTMWVKADRTDSPRVLLETGMMRVLYHPQHTHNSRMNGKEFVKITVGSCAEHLNVSTEAIVTVVTKHQSRLSWDTLRLGSLDSENSFSGELSNVNIYADHLSRRNKGALAFPGCACPSSHPIPSHAETYLCHSSSTSNSSSVLRPSAHLPYHLVLVDPQVLVDNLFKPYYWVSTPGLSEFRLSIDLPGQMKVGRVRITLGTALPSLGLYLETEVDGQRELWLAFSHICPSSLQVPCITSPRGPESTEDHPALWNLDTEGIITEESRATRKISLFFFGSPDQVPGRKNTHLTYHVVAEVQVFTLASSNTVKTSRAKDMIQDLDNGVSDLLSKLDSENLKYKMDQVKELSQFNTVIKQTGRFKRQISSAPKISRIFPPYGPEAGTRIVVRGENFGPPNVTIMIGNRPCECNGKILELEALKGQDGCNTESLAICDIWNGSALINQPLLVTLHKHDGTQAPENPNVTFVFRPNPTVTSVYPRESYVSGGRRVTMTGENMDSGADPRLILTTITFGIESPFDPQYSPCNVTNSTTVVCLTPRPDLPSTATGRKKRAITFYINDKTLDIVIGFQTGLYIQGNLIESLGQGGRMMIARDPKYKEFAKGEFELRFYEEPNPKLRIDSEGGMTLAAEKEDYNVTVGGVPCKVTELFAGSLICIPPKEEDIPKDSDRNNDGNPRASIHVGFQGAYTPGVVVYLYKKPVDYTGILAGVLAGVSAILLFLIILWCWIRHLKYIRLKERLAILDENYTSLVTDESTMMDLLQEDLRKKVDSCKLDPGTVKRSREIGEGNFGKVYVGRMSTKSNHKDSGHNEEYDVAIKTVKAEGVTLRQLEDFLEEATLMKDFHHKNVLKLLGVFVEHDRPFVVLPYMANGDLKGYVSDAQRNFKVFDLLDLLMQVANGMNYVSKQGTVHRDLRAVNCMVDAKIIVKVGDFGLARQMEEDYYLVQNQERPLPIKWMAPEALAGSKFSTYSDVWSYGVLMWEVMTRGLRPFADVDNYRLKTHVLRGGRLEKPPYCPDEVYRIMNSCWELKSRKRPLFREIQQMLAAFMKIQTDEVKEQLMMTKDIDEDYVEVMRERTATNEVNEYTKRPGPIPEYLTVLDETEVAVPNAEGHTSSTEHGNPTFEGSKAHHKYENDTYLHPSSHGSGPIDIPLLQPDENPTASSGDGEKPYFVNPPISDEYISASGHEKLAQSEHVPRGELYTENKKETKEEPDLHGESENVSDKEVEGSTENIRLYTVEDPDTEVSDYINQKTSSGEVQNARRESTNNVVDIPEGDQRRSGVRDLAAKFGGAAKTSDYTNQPAFMKRTRKQKAEEGKEGENVTVAVSGVPHRGNEVDGYVTCS